MQVQGENESADPAGRLLSGYRPLEGVPDELMGPDGTIRPAWRSFISAIAAIPPDELAVRMARGDQYLRDAGVFYRQYGTQTSAERDWPLSHMPVLIDEAEWAGITTALTERADLLEQVVADLYGENRLIAEGHLPPLLVAENSEWLRPLVGVTPRSGHFLHFIAFDIGRGPEGDWWVLGDRTQAPSGAGFALENRIATARVYSDHYARAHVFRLAGFFRRFRDTLQGLRATEDSRVGILTPGPLNDTYFEHAYIARYLGFMLLEGEDLTIRDGQLMVRTVAGPRPISVLWRRLDANWADPLELSETSRLGTAGMLGAVRAGNVTMINALGSGVLETRALMAFLPRIAEALNGRRLMMPNIATWWCGQAAERDYVLANAERMSLSDAFATRLGIDPDSSAASEAPASREALAARLAAEGARLVGQETVTLSTAPAFDGTVLAPRPMSLRVFLARTSDGWQAMPGGFARIGRALDVPRLAMQSGGSAADVWIVSRGPVATETLFAPASAPYTRQQPALLPSRAADNLFWLGRYVERAESTIRLLRAYHQRVAESGSETAPLIDYLGGYLEGRGVTREERFPAVIGETLGAASTAAGHVRDRFSVDGWMALNDLNKTIGAMAETAEPGDDMARAMGVLLRKLSGFSGLVHENMFRFTGWRLLSIGRALERAAALARHLSAFADDDAPEGGLDLAVEVADSAMTLRRRYAVSTNRATVIDLLALDPLNPRSVLYQLNEIAEHIGFLPGIGLGTQLTPVQRAVLRTQAVVATETAETLTTEMLDEVATDMAQISDLVSTAYLG